MSQFIWGFTEHWFFLNRINFFPFVKFVFFLFGILLSGKNNSFSSFCIEFLAGVHQFSRSYEKAHKKHSTEAVLCLLSYMSWAKVEVRNIPWVSEYRFWRGYILNQAEYHITYRNYRSDRISATSDKNLCCVFNGKLKTQTFFSWTAIILIRLCGQLGWYVSLQGAHVILLVLSCWCLNSVSSQCAHGKSFIARKPEVHSKCF